VTHTKQQKYFNHLKGRGYNENYIHNPLVDKNIFAVLYVSLCHLTHCYKTTVFLRLLMYVL